MLFVCGSDEHGVPVTIKAKKEGISPQDVVDRYDAIIRKSFADFGITFDTYGRTTSATHREHASEIFRTIYDKGGFIEEESEQYYDPEAKQFLADRYITGTCPRCQYERAYGDQCEHCGSTLNPSCVNGYSRGTRNGRLMSTGSVRVGSTEGYSLVP